MGNGQSHVEDINRDENDNASYDSYEPHRYDPQRYHDDNNDGENGKNNSQSVHGNRNFNEANVVLHSQSHRSAKSLRVDMTEEHGTNSHSKSDASKRSSTSTSGSSNRYESSRSTSNSRYNETNSVITYDDDDDISSSNVDETTNSKSLQTNTESALYDTDERSAMTDMAHDGDDEGKNQEKRRKKRRSKWTKHLMENKNSKQNQEYNDDESSINLNANDDDETETILIIDAEEEFSRCSNADVVAQVVSAENIVAVASQPSGQMTPDEQNFNAQKLNINEGRGPIEITKIKPSPQTVNQEISSVERVDVVERIDVEQSLFMVDGLKGDTVEINPNRVNFNRRIASDRKKHLPTAPNSMASDPPATLFNMDDDTLSNVHSSSLNDKFLISPMLNADRVYMNQNILQKTNNDIEPLSVESIPIVKAIDLEISPIGDNVSNQEPSKELYSDVSKTSQKPKRDVPLVKNGKIIGSSNDWYAQQTKTNKTASDQPQNFKNIDHSTLTMPNASQRVLQSPITNDNKPSDSILLEKSVVVSSNDKIIPLVVQQELCISGAKLSESVRSEKAEITGSKEKNVQQSSKKTGVNPFDFREQRIIPGVYKVDPDGKIISNVAGGDVNIKPLRRNYHKTKHDTTLCINEGVISDNPHPRAPLVASTVPGTSDIHRLTNDIAVPIITNNVLDTHCNDMTNNVIDFPSQLHQDMSLIGKMRVDPDGDVAPKTSENQDELRKFSIPSVKKYSCVQQGGMHSSRLDEKTERKVEIPNTCQVESISQLVTLPADNESSRLTNTKAKANRTKLPINKQDVKNERYLLHHHWHQNTPDDEMVSKSSGKYNSSNLKNTTFGITNERKVDNHCDMLEDDIRQSECYVIDCQDLRVDLDIANNIKPKSPEKTLQENLNGAEITMIVDPTDLDNEQIISRNDSDVIIDLMRHPIPSIDRKVSSPKPEDGKPRNRKNLKNPSIEEIDNIENINLNDVKQHNHVTEQKKSHRNMTKSKSLPLPRNETLVEHMQHSELIVTKTSQSPKPEDGKRRNRYMMSQSHAQSYSFDGYDKLDDIDLDVVKQYDETFNILLERHPEFMTNHPDWIETIRIAKLQKILSTTLEVEHELSDYVQSLVNHKKEVTDHYTTKLLDASQKKAKQEILLQKELYETQQNVNEYKKKILWDTISAYKEYCQYMHNLQMELSLHVADDHDPINILPEAFGTQKALLYDALTCPYDDDNFNDEIMDHTQAENNMLYQQAQQLEDQLALLQHQYNQEYVDSIICSLTEQEFWQLQHQLSDK